VLIVLHGAPSSAPAEAVLDEQLIAQIRSSNFIRVIGLAINVRLTCGRLYYLMTVFPTIPYIGVIERIDIDGQSTGML
jgi:hypothetical protein